MEFKNGRYYFDSGDLKKAAQTMEDDPIDGLKGNQEPIKRACHDYWENPQDKDLLAILICVIDSTNSTGLTRKKRGNEKQKEFGVMNIASFCIKNDFIDSVKSGEAEKAETMIQDFWSEYQINLFSLFSKLFCYCDLFVFERDNFSIYDSVVGQHLYLFDCRSSNPILKSNPARWRANASYSEYNSAIEDILNGQGISEEDDSFRRRHLDNLIWGKFASGDESSNQ